MVVVRSRVEGANISVDRVTRGASPAEVALPEGSHVIRVERDGYEPQERMVLVHAGSRRVVELDPLARSPITTKWWFWAGVGLVVAAGATVVAALLTEGPPADG